MGRLAKISNNPSSVGPPSSRVASADASSALTDADRALGLRPLTARSVLVSMLLGTHPPRLPVRSLMASAELFGISRGAARTALSRLVAAGDLRTEGGRYELQGGLLHRQRSQDAGREARVRPWDGRWATLIAPAKGRSAADRSTEREALAAAHFAQLRDGLWVRPDNLDAHPGLAPLTAAGWLGGRTEFDVLPPVAELWPLGQWRQQAEGLRSILAELTPRLEEGDQSDLARGFVVAAGTLRLFRADPLLPQELLPDAWPGAEVRAHYDRFDTAYRDVLQGFLRSQR